MLNSLLKEKLLYSESVLRKRPLQEAGQWHQTLAELLLKEKKEAEITLAVSVPPLSPSSSLSFC